MKNGHSEFVVCVCNEGYVASLELRKLYQVVPDQEGLKHRMIRVIDESGEDYLYPKKFFLPIHLPLAISRLVFKARQ